VIGVHSPKFRHEADPAALADAVVHYGIGHPVLDDADLVTWRAYAAKAWPTLVLVDPEGFIVARYAGEGHAHAIDAVLADRVPKARAAGVLVGGATPAQPPLTPPSDLLYPAGLLRLPDSRLLIADTAHHQLVLTDATGENIVRRVGTGERGWRDGAADVARLNEPQGMCLLPEQVARAVGYDVVVADTVNHALRGVQLEDAAVTTVAGFGEAWTALRPDRLSSPWDVEWWQDAVWAAMAGIHQLWTFDPRTGVAAPAAGTRTEGLRDGALAEAWFAQPSGLAADGDRLWLADAETSALRWVVGGEVHTAVGHGLFDFGFRDGSREEARLQHPLGVAVLPGGDVAVADTYNGAVRRYDVRTGTLSTIADGLREPVQLVAGPEGIDVLEAAAHRVRTVPYGAQAVAPEQAERSERPPTPLAAEQVDLVVEFTPPPGQHLDERYGTATRLSVSATPAALLRSGDGTTAQLRRTLLLNAAVGGGVLHVSASAASCDIPVDTGVVGAACHLHQQDWGLPVIITDSGLGELRLALGAVSAEDA
jgi:hypothetical protein